MNAKIVLLCACFLLLCLVAKAEDAGSNAIASSVSNKTYVPEEQTQKELFFKEGRDEALDREGHSNSGLRAGGIGLTVQLNAHGNASISIEIKGGMRYYNCPPGISSLDQIQDPLQYECRDRVVHYKDLEKEGWKKWAKRLSSEQPKQMTEEEMKKMPLWITAKHNQITIINSGRNYVAIKPVEFIPRYKSIDETPKILQESGWVFSYGGKKTWARGLREQFPGEGPPPIWKSVIYDWKYWPNVVPESERAAQSAGIRTLTVPPSKNFYCNGISFSWETSPMQLNYEVKLSSIEKLEFALVKGAKLADINTPAKFDFNTANHWQGSYGKIPVELNDVIIFRLNGEKCFAFALLKVEDSGVVKTSSNEVQNKSVVYEQRDWSKAKPTKPPELVKTAQNK